ncbi:MAG: pilus assembly PilX family protein, partial [Thiobacillaceae bacterium]
MSIPAPSDCVIACAKPRPRALARCRRAEPSAQSGQNGAALIIGLIMMALLSLLGLAALNTSLLEERMAANARDRMRALQAAEAALR